MQLSLRLSALTDTIEKTDTLLDVGCDHGLLEKALVERDKARRVIAADISAPSLEKARRLVSENGLEDRVECRLGSGFSVLQREDAVDAAVIAGIGGLVISRILEEGADAARKIKTLYLLPSCDTKTLRTFLRKNGWKRERETLVLDAGRIYAIMRVRRGEETAPGGIYDEFGFLPVITCDPLAKMLAKRYLHAMKKALCTLEKGGGDEERTRRIRRAIGQTKILLMKIKEKET